MASLMERLDNNAMFYKDITQWLRNKTFTSLFFGLLITAEIISLAMIFKDESSNQLGMKMYYILCLVLVVYGLIVGSMARNHTKAEYQSGTFELFVLCGMTDKEMVKGKLFTMIYEFGFGFFCLVPFMFNAYILGGLDVLDMLIGCLLIWTLMIPYFLMRLCGALAHREENKIVSIIFRTIIWYFVLTTLVPMAIGSLSSGIKEILQGNIAALLNLISFSVIYGIFVVATFYICCVRIRRIGTLERATVE